MDMVTEDTGEKSTALYKSECLIHTLFILQTTEVEFWSVGH